MHSNSVLENIRHRRTVKPDRFTGNAVPDEIVWQMLEAANWAPTHGHTEPWRFIVFTGESKKELLHFLNNLEAEVYGANEVKVQKRTRSFDASSHIIAIGMKRGDNPKIPEVEELLATAMAVENLWLAANALGYGGYWSTGALAYRQEFANFLGLHGDEDKAMGVFYLGEPIPGIPDGNRLVPLAEKVDWR